MHLKHKEFYKKFGLRFKSGFTNPVVIENNLLDLPRYNITHLFNPDEEYPIKSSSLIRDTNKTLIYNILKYTNPKFNVKELVINEKSIVADLNKRYPEVPTILSYKYNIILDRDTKVLKDTNLIINYSEINKHYRYLENPYTPYYKYVNAVTTLVDTIKNVYDRIKHNKRNKFNISQTLVIEIPNQIFDLSIIKKYINEDVTLKYMQLFFNNKHKLLLDLFRLLDNDTLEKSNLKGLLDNTEMLKDIDLLLTYNNKVTILNLNKLLSFSKSYEDITSDVSKIEKEELIKLFYIYLKDIVTKSNTDNDDSENEVDEIDDAVVMRKLKEDIESSNVVADEEEEIIEDTIEDIDIPETDIRVTDTYVNKYSTKKDLITGKATLEEETIANIEELYINKQIDKKKYDKMVSDVNAILNKPSPFGGKDKIKDLINIKHEDIDVPNDLRKIYKPVTVFNEEDANDTITAINKKYMKDTYKKDMASVIMGIQKSGIVIKDIEVTTHADILGEYEDYSITISDKGKAPYTIKQKIPKVNEDGVYSMSGNAYLMRKKKYDAPIKKINYNRVSLSSAYGKLFIDKAPYKKMDRGFSFKKELIKLVEEGVVSNLISGTLNAPDLKLPQTYMEIARYTKSFKIKGYTLTFNYMHRHEILDKKYDLNKIEKNGKIFIGFNNKKVPLLMDNDNNVFLYEDKLKPLGNFYEFIGIDANNLKTEYSLIKIYKDYIPMALLLSYYLGITELLKLLKIEYELLEGNKRASDNDTLVIKFSDSTLVLKPTTSLQKMVIYGLTYDLKSLRTVPYSLLDNKTLFPTLFKTMDYKLVVVNKITAIETLFLDPITANVLKEINEPTTFIPLLIRANELLITDEYLHPTSAKGFLFKGYEVIPEALYRTMAKAIEKKMSEEHFGRGKVVVNPYEVWSTVNEDSASILIDDLNPILFLKQKEDTTYLGAGNGRQKESMSKATREFHKDDIGIISESSKDSSDVGITAYMSANPVLKTVRGDKKDVKELEWVNILSTSAMISPFSTRDDPKRVLYTNIMNSHIVPIADARVFPVRTGYESIIPYRAGPKFVGIAEEDGKVTKVGKHNATITYKTIGKKAYKFNDWTSKEESGTAYVHIMKSNLIENKPIKKGDIIYYDSSFFDIDMFDNTKVLYRPGKIINVAMIESSETNEDAMAISKRIATDTKINFVKIREVTLDKTDNVMNVVNINDEVTNNDALFTISTDMIGDEKLNKETLALMESFIKSTPKAKYNGRIIKIQAFYNCEYDELSKSLQRLVDITEPFMVDSITNKKFSGRVNSSYSVNSKPLDEGKIHIKFFINEEKGMVTGDKGIIANMLKTTITTVVDEPMLTESNDEVDALFSYIGISARIVSSPVLMGTTATLLQEVTKQALELYDN